MTSTERQAAEWKRQADEVQRQIDERRERNRRPEPTTAFGKFWRKYFSADRRRWFDPF